MKKLINVIIIALMLSSACSNPNNKIGYGSKDSNPKDSVDVFMKITYGKNLKRDFEIYLNSLLYGDVEATFKYTHEISMGLLRQNFPLYKTDKELSGFFRSEFIKAGVLEMNKSLDMKFIPGEIVGGINNNQLKIYWIEYLKKGSNSTDNINIQSNVIAISDNNGKNWKFIEFDIPNKDKFINLLSEKYPVEYVNQVFNKEIPKKKMIIPENLITSNKSEFNLLEDLTKYMDCFKENDPKKAIEYIYPEVFNYFNENGKNNIDALNSALVEIFDKASISVNNGYKPTFITDAFLSKTTYQSNLLYIVHFYLFNNDEYGFYSTSGECIAISSDSGLNWKFVAICDETPSILKRNFPKTTIDELLNY